MLIFIVVGVIALLAFSTGGRVEDIKRHRRNGRRQLHGATAYVATNIKIGFYVLLVVAAFVFFLVQGGR